MSKDPETLLWFADPSWNTTGCFNENLEPTLYTKIEILHPEYIDDPLPISVTDLALEVRSSHDPILYAMIVTDHTLKFGMSSKELKLIGIVLIICCGGLMIQPICWYKNNCKGVIFQK